MHDNDPRIDPPRRLAFQVPWIEEHVPEEIPTPAEQAVLYSETKYYPLIDERERRLQALGFECVAASRTGASRRIASGSRPRPKTNANPSTQADRGGCLSCVRADQSGDFPGRQMHGQGFSETPIVPQLRPSALREFRLAISFGLS